MESLEAVSAAIDQHVDTCNSFRNIWFGIALVVAGYMVAMGVYVFSNVADHDRRIEAISAAMQATTKELGAIQIADRKAFQDAMASERQRITDTIAVVTNSQIDRTRQAVEAVNKSDGTTREELRALRQEIKELREKIEAGMHSMPRRP